MCFKFLLECVVHNLLRQVVYQSIVITYLHKYMYSNIYKVVVLLDNRFLKHSRSKFSERNNLQIIVDFRKLVPASTEVNEFILGK